MASIPSPKDPEKLIYAPSGAQAHAQAEQFTKGTLHRDELDSSPVRQFQAWFAAAQRAAAGSTTSLTHPETCTLATASLPSGRVSARTLYLKELDAHGGFVVYTNLGTSRKAADIFGVEGAPGAQANRNVALVFWWEALQRQVRVEGMASRMSREASQAYFDTRVRGSRVGAWASHQSEVLPPQPDVEGDDGRALLDNRVHEFENEFAGVEQIPVPEHWGGLRIVPDRMEFWQGRDGRLHDRFVYDKVQGEEDQWELSRLNP